MTNTANSSLRPFERRFKANKQSFADHLAVTEQLQAELSKDVQELADQDGWDETTRQGVNAWLEDKEVIFRFLKRNSYDEKKAYHVLQTALSNRALHSLHRQVPIVPPYSASPLFYVLPLPRFTDKLGRPIAVLTPREIKRNEHHSLDELIHWIWWASEMLRRTLHDYWVNGVWTAGKPKGEGGEGCVVIIDAAGSGYRHLEFELVPTFNQIGSKNFPGMIESAFVINAGWGQRSLWKILRPILPRPAVERIGFVDKLDHMNEVFDLDRLPQVFGGHDPYIYSPKDNPVLDYYQQHDLSHVETIPTSPTPQENGNGVS